MEPTGHGSEGVAGRVLGGYVLERELGRGLTGTVLLGRRASGMPALVERTAAAPLELPALAAVKVLIPPRQASQKEEAEFRARFEREARTLQRLRHPHLVPVLASGEEDGLLYMVLPYLPGGTLADRVSSGGLPLPDVERWLTQIAAALDYAHGEGIIHRDLKPANVLLDGDGNASLADFSIARLAQGTQLTTSKAVMGTYDYMAPEQASTGKVEPAADIYSLGCLVYQLIAGRVPFTATEVAQVILKHVTEPPPAPRALRPDLPEPAEAAILKALAKRPEQRFATAGALARAFREGLAGQWTPGLTAYVGLAAGSVAPAQGDVTTVRQSLPRPPVNKWRLPVVVGSLLLLSTLLVTGTLAASQLGIGLHSTSTPTQVALATHTPFPPTVTVGPGTPTPTPRPGQPTPTLAPGQPIPPITPPGQPTPIPATNPTSTAGPPVAIYGDGSDGPLTVSSNIVDSPLDATCSGSSGTTTLSFANASGPFAFLNGKPILIHQSQGTSAGAWMRNTIASAPGTTSGTLTLATPLNASYSTGCQVIVLRQYTDVTVNAGVTWSAKPWDGAKGGILAFLVNGRLSNSGTISASGKGFRGGIGNRAPGEGQQGESELSIGGFSATARGVGGGGGGDISGNGVGGGIYGSADLATMIFGGGGGGTNTQSGHTPQSGGNGGGILFFAAVNVTNNGAIVANGQTPSVSDSFSIPGSGAGGSILITTQVAPIGSGVIAAAGGTSLTASNSLGGANGAGGGYATAGANATDSSGGAGGTGRIFVG
jgi:serine/threonine protein kinase